MNSPLAIPREGNEWFPLPSDYPELTQEGQRLARVNACRLWLLPGDPSFRAEMLVASTRYFDWYYLEPDPNSSFDPGFYDQPPLPSAPYHWDITRIWGSTQLALIIAPRGGAKSVHSEKDSLLRLTSCERWSEAYVTSTHDNARHTGNRLRDQLFENPRIRDDFGVLKPVRGQKSMGVDYLRLQNGSWLRCASVEARLRGLRVRQFKLDDPEHDAKASTSLEKLRENMERFVFSIVIPMVSRARCAVRWTATFVSPRHFAYYAMQTKQTPEGPRAIDPRFDMWHRYHIKGERRGPNGERISCWPHMWPATREQAIELGVPDAWTLPALEQAMGPRAYRREMLGILTSNEDSYFKIDLDPSGDHAWWVEQVDDAFTSDVRGSTALMCFRRKVAGETVVARIPLHEWLNTVRLFITVDTAFTEKQTSDRRVCTLMGVDSDNVLFVLDMWSGKKGDDVLLRKSLEMAHRWRCPVVFVETVKESYKLFHRFEHASKTAISEAMGIDWNFAVRALKPGTMKKSAKIATLDVRFEHHLIKLPLYARGLHPWWGRLIDQVLGFDPDASEDGGLANDDELDTVAMSLQALRGRLREGGAPRLSDDAKVDVLAALREGKTELHGIPLNSLPLDLLDQSVISEILSRGYHPPSEKSRL